MLKLALDLQTCKYRPVKALYHWLLVVAGYEPEAFWSCGNCSNHCASPMANIQLCQNWAMNSFFGAIFKLPG